ncbi:hypothetical protein QYE76_060820 [Lolium multiflorum]|uniref:Integrase zinc-binding domain-containing protein n=1 Tax=Lolium multiflorum TaxID=4521 RepID=A0AAD8S0S5_LOLMU|nr:hypothetical protein QYE76_060820 [Lolium multiflorum]
MVERRKNEEAMRCQNRVQATPTPSRRRLDIVDHPSVCAPRELDIAEPPPDSTLVALAADSIDWTEPYISYLERQTLPMDEAKARAIVRKCKSFTIINNELYKRSVSGVFQRCVATEGRNILRDIHRGCGHHAGARSIVAKAFRHGFYRPTAHEDAVALVRSCAGCQNQRLHAFLLVYGAAVMPTDIAYDSPRVANYAKKTTSELAKMTSTSSEGEISHSPNRHLPSGISVATTIAVFGSLLPNRRPQYSG